MSSEMEVHQAPAAPARVTPPRQKTDDWALVIGPVSQLAEQVANTDFVPSALRGKPAAVAAAILFGRELDMPPMQALNQVHVIEGRPSLSAEHMRAMVLAAGHILRVSGDGGQATAVGRRLLPDGTYDEPVTVTWTLASARAAGLVTEKRKNWLKYPRQMLKARATAELCRDLFPDITHGLDAVEEAEDADSEPTSAPTPATESVSRAKKRVASRPAVGVGTAETPAPAATKTPDSVTPPEVPLPGEEEPAATPGEGLGNQSISSPAGPPSMQEAQRADLEAYDETTDQDARERYAEEQLAGADAVAYLSAGDGSPDDLAATATDEVWEAAQEATGGPVEENDPPINRGAQRALFAAFNSLGVRDDMERYHTTSALLGRQITTWADLTRSDGERLFKAVEAIKTRDELEELVQRAAAEWGSNGTP